MIARVVSLVALVSLVGACGASTTSPGGGAGSSGSGSSSSGGSGSGSSSGGSSSGGSSSGGGPGSGPCPATLPSTALSSPTPCSSALEGVSCEYGDDPDPGCNDVVTCVNGTWSNASNSDAQTCPTPAATGACPATYAAAQSAGTCTQSGLACGYAEGRCDCARPTGGPPIVGGSGTRWLCDAPPTGCPVPRPHYGAACTASQPQECDYGACTIPDGVTLTCKAGTWQSEPTACAE